MKIHTYALIGILLSLTACNKELNNFEITERQKPDSSNKQDKWFTVNMNLTGCIESEDEPNDLFKHLSQMEKSTVQEYKDGYGNLYKLLVSKSDTNNTRQTQTYYKSREICEYEQIDTFLIPFGQHR
jgi:hypothetical protein